MTCSDVREVLPVSLVPGGSDARTLLAVEEHLVACEACRDEKLDLLRSLTLLELDRPEAPDLVPAIAARLDAEPLPIRLWPRRLAAAVAGLAAVLALTWAYRAGRTPDRPQPDSGPKAVVHVDRGSTDGALLPSVGHDLRLDRFVEVPSSHATLVQEEWIDAVFDGRTALAGLGVGLALPSLVPAFSGEDEEQVFPLDIGPF